MKVAILGYDTEGRASFDYFTALGHEVTICDQKTSLETPVGSENVLGAAYLDNLDRFDLVIRTAGMPPSVILDKNPGLDDKITTQINEFLRICPTKNVIGVTGTKGKGTTSTLIANMLAGAGKDVQLGGNIGVPPFTFLDKLSADSWVVLELSSFQLVDLRLSPHLAVCLMVVPEHLDWHSDMPDYIAAKSRLFMHQQVDDTAIFFAGNELSTQIASASQGKKIPYFALPGAVVENDQIVIDKQIICQTDELKLLGEHNWQNACAAVTTAWQVTQDVPVLRSILTTFNGLPHRLELVRTLAGVSYYDDSFGTTPDTAIVALQAFTQPKVLILGGSDKGASYEALAHAVSKGNVRQVLLIGEQAARLQQALEAAQYTNFLPGGTTMKEIVANAKSHARTGDVVLLSPACASFDMFKDYKDRGAQFSAAVQSLPAAVQ